jgi:hypothetical protein
MAPRGMSFRAQRSAELFEADASITLDEFGQYTNIPRSMALPIGCSTI